MRCHGRLDRLHAVVAARPGRSATTSRSGERLHPSSRPALRAAACLRKMLFIAEQRGDRALADRIRNMLNPPGRSNR